MFYTVIDSPIDPLLLTGDGEYLTGVYLDGDKRVKTAASGALRDEGPFRECIEQLEAYFGGDLLDFELPIKPVGTEFQRAVWESLSRIAYGETASYKSIADDIGAPKAVRAVGLANGKNPLAIVVPCHRVIGANGKLTGYAGGLPRKQWLLAHEAATHGASMQMTLPRL